MGFDRHAPQHRTCDRCGRRVNITSNLCVRYVEEGTRNVVNWYARKRKRFGTLTRTDVHELSCSKRAGDLPTWI